MRFFVLLWMLFCFKVFSLTANISKNKIVIDLDFTGDEITVFGRKEGKGEIVIIFKSQKVSYKVYGKQKIFGIWQNTNPRIFKEIYNTYRLKSENVINFGKEDIFRDFEIGMQNINFYNFTSTKSVMLNSDYKEAFLKHKKKDGSFSEELGAVKYFPKSDMFLTKIEIPSNVKPGDYSLEIFLISGNELKEVMVFDINVEQVGFLLKVKEIAFANKKLYAGISVFVSIAIAFFAFYLAKVLYYNRLK